MCFRLFLKGYYPDDIYYVDETALFYKALPNKTISYKNLDDYSVKVCKERVSMLLCANTSRKDKLKTILIGNSENPRAFKSITRTIFQYFIGTTKKHGWPKQYSLIGSKN